MGDSLSQFRAYPSHPCRTMTDYEQHSTSQARVLMPPVPHPMNCLRPIEYVSHCKVCGGWTNYVCASCSSGTSYCSPAHLEQVSAPHAADGIRSLRYIRTGLVDALERVRRNRWRQRTGCSRRNCGHNRRGHAERSVPDRREETRVVCDC